MPSVASFDEHLILGAANRDSTALWRAHQTQMAEKAAALAAVKEFRRVLRNQYMQNYELEQAVELLAAKASSKKTSKRSTKSSTTKGTTGRKAAAAKPAAKKTG